MRRSASSDEHQHGYHIIFVVQKITDRLDAGERAVLRIVRRFYGETACRHIVLLRTHSDVCETPEEISLMTQEAKVDVEMEMRGHIAGVIAINNHASRSDTVGKDRVMSGWDMVSAIHDVVCYMPSPEPFKPSEVDYDTVVEYVNEEAERNHTIKKDIILAAVLRLVPVTDKRRNCAIL